MNSSVIAVLWPVLSTFNMWMRSRRCFGWRKRGEALHRLRTRCGLAVRLAAILLSRAASGVGLSRASRELQELAGGQAAALASAPRPRSFWLWQDAPTASIHAVMSATERRRSGNDPSETGMAAEKLRLCIGCAEDVAWRSTGTCTGILNM